MSRPAFPTVAYILGLFRTYLLVAVASGLIAFTVVAAVARPGFVGAGLAGFVCGVMTGLLVGALRQRQHRDGLSSLFGMWTRNIPT